MEDRVKRTKHGRITSPAKSVLWSKARTARRTRSKNVEAGLGSLIVQG